jgi:hypothetical protein
MSENFVVSTLAQKGVFYVKLIPIWPETKFAGAGLQSAGANPKSAGAGLQSGCTGTFLNIFAFAGAFHPLSIRYYYLFVMFC